MLIINQILEIGEVGVYKFNPTKSKLLLVACFFSFVAQAQWQVQSTYVNSKIGTGGINLLVAKQVNNHRIGIGLRVNLYSLAHKDDQGNIYTNRFYPIDFYQKFGLAGFYQYNFLSRLKPTRLYGFFDVQLAHGPTRNRITSPYITLPDGTTLYEESFERFGPFLWMENTIGLGLQLVVHKNLDFHAQVGYGLMSIIGDKRHGKDNTANLGRPFYDWELTYMFQVGFVYSFRKD
jgi:hypothetical protein